MFIHLYTHLQKSYFFRTAPFPRFKPIKLRLLDYTFLRFCFSWKLVVWYDPFAATLLFYALENNVVGPPYNSTLPHLARKPMGPPQTKVNAGCKELRKHFRPEGLSPPQLSLPQLARFFLLPLDYGIHLQPPRGFSFTQMIAKVGVHLDHTLAAVKAKALLQKPLLKADTVKGVSARPSSWQRYSWYFMCIFFFFKEI